MKQKPKMKKNTLRFFWVMIFVCLLLPAGLTACRGDDEEEISFWDESYPEEILEELADVPAYVETIDELSYGIYTCGRYHKSHPNNAELSQPYFLTSCFIAKAQLRIIGNRRCQIVPLQL